ncbi:hypothetical protein DIC66_22370 [Rhodoferax lacus]|uniref:Uncharacterized protein n=1 Tax=Rhodoferax lacus TaxID=2184758 RepID=A0A3E1R5M6_9BURK|nr:hypothetical protein DIC66_22370 [Rhodoferax lacus]
MAIAAYVWRSQAALAREYVTARVESGAVAPTVTASGTLNPVTTVRVGSYRQSLLLAFAQLADGLQALDHDTSLVGVQHKELDAARSTQDPTQQSFEARQSDFQRVIEAQRQC